MSWHCKNISLFQRLCLFTELKRMMECVVVCSYLYESMHLLTENKGWMLKKYWIYVILWLNLGMFPFVHYSEQSIWKISLRLLCMHKYFIMPFFSLSSWIWCHLIASRATWVKSLFPQCIIYVQHSESKIIQFVGRCNQAKDIKWYLYIYALWTFWQNDNYFVIKTWNYVNSNENFSVRIINEKE